MVFFMHSDWLLKLKIFSAIKLRLFNPKFIDETDGKVICLKMQIKS